MNPLIILIRKFCSWTVLFVVLLVVAVQPTKAQETTPETSPVNAPRSVKAYAKNGSEIALDGRLSEEIWDEVSYTSGFVQREPREGRKATEETKVAFVYSDEALYIGARMYSENPSQIQAQLSRRDNIGNAERLVISLDTYLDRRTARSFVVTASSVRGDYFQPRDEMSYRSRDYSYDPVWTAKSHIDSVGWTAEMRIPYSQLRYSEQEEQIWGLNINRYLPHKNEDVFWVMVPQDETGWASRFGLLTGIENISKARQIEFLPYVAGNALVKGAPDPQNPFVDNFNMEARVGGNFKFGLGPNLKLDGTINPDFGQVEADPAQVNLSAFETFFEEKRPFFTENQQLFQVLGGRSTRYFYSRRIGAAPSLDPEGEKADFVDRTSNTSILGASKITGRFSNGFSLGGLATVTASEQAQIYDVESDSYDKIEVEPLTSYGVVRVQQEFGEYSSTVGGMLTGVHRSLSPGTELADLLNRNAITGGTDWNLRFDDGEYELSGDLGFSYISGSQDAIARVQQTSARYYQRPDASYLVLDSTRTSLSGYRGRLEVSKNAGAHWLWEVQASAKSPGFELNDTGILSRADDISSRAELTYRENTPGSWYQSYRLRMSLDGAWNFGGIRRESSLELNNRIEYKNFWSHWMSVEYTPRTYNDRLTRGGPLMGSPAEMAIRGELSTDRSANLFAELFINYQEDEFGGWDWQIRPAIQIRSGKRWEAQLRPRLSLQTNTRQYITTLAGGEADTYGNRYVFSTIERSTFSLQTRFNYAFSPDLTLEMYAEPFVASGNYYNPGELPNPRSYKLDRYNINGRTAGGDYIVQRGGSRFTVPSNDFLVKSFRSSIVLRYQWRPGSTFFLVWQQNRFAEEEKSRFVEPGDLVNALGETGDNILSVKFTYWFSAN